MAAATAPAALGLSIFLVQLLLQGHKRKAFVNFAWLCNYLLVFFCFGCACLASECRMFYVRNNCPYPVWPATLGSPQLPQTGFLLQSSAAVPLAAPPRWSGRLWGRSLCSMDPSGRFSCATGDCGTGQLACDGAGGVPPATLTEFTLDGDDGNDYYDVSNVDGFNIPVMVTPLGGSGCRTASCAANMNALCPGELQVVSGGCVVACKSGCLAFGTDAYCCTAGFGSPESCKPTNYSVVFKSACPLARSYAYDNDGSALTCAGVDYLVDFCP
ncbi:hypothetical protein Taro_048599 [Colocasia esculenta]|uniref:Thaumatin-like protein n=1 Tax=Colocasia esculenta TaxID=4460 RepID=A0A843X8K1_COLES|nr:hypothetical protein [Colocasia esculenta]